MKTVADASTGSPSVQSQYGPIGAVMGVTEGPAFVFQGSDPAPDLPSVKKPSYPVSFSAAVLFTIGRIWFTWSIVSVRIDRSPGMDRVLYWERQRSSIVRYLERYPAAFRRVVGEGCVRIESAHTSPFRWYRPIPSLPILRTYSRVYPRLGIPVAISSATPILLVGSKGVTVAWPEGSNAATVHTAACGKDRLIFRHARMFGKLTWGIQVRILQVLAMGVLIRQESDGGVFLT